MHEIRFRLKLRPRPPEKLTALPDYGSEDGREGERKEGKGVPPSFAGAPSVGCVYRRGYINPWRAKRKLMSGSSTRGVSVRLGGITWGVWGGASAEI